MILPYKKYVCYPKCEKKMAMEINNTLIVKKKSEIYDKSSGKNKISQVTVVPVEVPFNATQHERKTRNLKLARKVECTFCKKIISDRRNLNRHLHSIHNINPKIRKLKVKCSFSNNCSFVCATYTVLRNHLESVHGFNIVEKKYRFQKRSDFEKWKEEEEIKTWASYVADTGAKYRKQKKIHYLRCHRSGSSRAKSNGNKERLRSRPMRGYTQCGLTCPSTMQILENQNGEIEVCYFPKHLGHEMGDEAIKYMKLRKKDKEDIAAKLVQGEQVSKIVSEARTNKNLQLSRFNLLQRRDVYNIKSKVKFLEKEGDQDGKLIDSWMRQLHLRLDDDNLILFYNPIDQDKNYMLVIIHIIQKIIFSLLFDGSIVYVKTKKGKANIDFNLTIIYVINENGNGYPIAFCVSRKNDYLTILKFFQVIFDTYGMINAQIFVSDNLNYFYAAWKNVMGETDNKLICNFNIHSHWDQRLVELKCPLKKHIIVLEKLKSLLNELNGDVFGSELVDSLNSWREDVDLKLFVNFFYKYYCKKPYEWANCFRVHSVRKENINKYLEPFFTQIERIYLEGTKHVHNALNSIFLLIRDECYMKLIEWDDEILGDKIKEIEKNHIVSKDVENILYNGCEWIVRYGNEDFKVKRSQAKCANNCCVKCYACQICFHDFTCLCRDYLINFSICVHIHAVAMKNSLKLIKIRQARRDKCLSSSTLKLSAISLSKTITDYLHHSEMTDLEYDKIILDLDSFIKDHSLKEKFKIDCSLNFFGE